MAKVIAVCNNIPDTIHTMLAELKQTSIQFLESHTSAPEKLKKDILFIFSAHDFKANLKIINSETYKNKTIFLFCPVVFAKSLTNINYLDVAKGHKDSCSIKSTYKSLCPDVLSSFISKSFTTKQIVEKDKKFKYILIENVRAGSLLNPLMTLLYTVKAEPGVKLKQIILSWLVSKDSLSHLEKQLKAKYEWGTVTKRFCDKLLELLGSDIGQQYKKVLIKATEKKGDSEFNLVSYAKKHGIDDYEIRYVLNTLLKAKQVDLNGKNIADLHSKEHRVLKK